MLVCSKQNPETHTQSAYRKWAQGCRSSYESKSPFWPLRLYMVGDQCTCFNGVNAKTFCTWSTKKQTFCTFQIQFSSFMPKIKTSITNKKFAVKKRDLYPRWVLLCDCKLVKFWVLKIHFCFCAKEKINSYQERGSVQMLVKFLWGCEI